MLIFLLFIDYQIEAQIILSMAMASLAMIMVDLISLFQMSEIEIKLHHLVFCSKWYNIDHDAITF